RTEKAAKYGDAKLKKEMDSLSKAKEWLEKGNNISTMEIHETEELYYRKDLQLLTIKPEIYIANVEEHSLNGNLYVDMLKNSISPDRAELIIISAALEAQLAELNDDEKMMFLKEYGLEEPGLNKLIKAAYHILDLITFFTVGEKEVKAWTVRRGWKAPEAAGVIHTDFEKGFIRAEVIKYDEFIHYRNESACRDAGKIAIEGKDYIVQDGDIMHFRFNV
ncbi:MAG TPA: DUF933 domain-containing protein, partial [Cyclobacteriaceae bacterium]|nr:DUF933 domain-containing protein [Cyclobacteriaceae bacterium]